MRHPFQACSVAVLCCLAACAAGQDGETAGTDDASRDVTRLIKQAGSDDVRERIEAIGKLEVVDPVDFAPQFIEALESGSPAVRQIACKKLRDSENPAAVPALVVVLQTDNAAAVRRSCAGALGELGDVRALEPLVRAAREDPSDDVRKFSVVALGSLGEDDATVPLGQALTGPRPESSVVVREAIVRTLGRLRDPRGVKPLIAAYEVHHSPRIVEALAAIGDARADAFLRSTLLDPDGGEGRKAIPGLLLARIDGKHDDFLLEQARSAELPSTRAFVYRAALEADLSETRRLRFERLARDAGLQDTDPEVRAAAAALVE